MRIPAVCLTVIVAPLALSGCSADWEGEQRTAEERCELAAQLFLPVIESSDAELAEAFDAEAGQGAERLSRTELAEALRAHTPEDMHEVLELYAQPGPSADSAAPAAEPDEQEAIARLLEERTWAEEAMRGWAQIACEEEIAAASMEQTVAAELPGLDMMQLIESELDGVALFRVAGALEPGHAVALCEEAREREPDARIEVTDSDGFPLALAPEGEACAVNPILLDE